MAPRHKKGGNTNSKYFTMADDIVARFIAEQKNLIQGLEQQKKLYRDLDQASEELGKDSQKSFDKAEKGAKDTNREFGNLEKKTGKLDSVITRLGTTIAATLAVDRIIRFGAEAVQLAGKVEGVRRAFNALNSPTLLNDLRKATRGTVSDLELMQAAVRAKNFKVPLQQLATYFEFATKRAAQTGEEVDYLVNSIIDGIGRKSTLVLDNLGISATELQAEIKRTGDFGEAAGVIIARELEKAGEVIETTAQKTARLTAENENLKVEIGEKLTPVYNELLESASGTLSGISALMDDQVSWVTKLKAALLSYTGAFGQQAIAELEAEKAIADANRQRVVELEMLRRAEGQYQKEAEIKKQNGGLTTEQKEAQEALNKAIEEYSQKVNALIPDLRALEREILDGLLSKGNLVKFWEDQSEKLSLDDLIEISEEEEGGVLLPGFEEDLERIKELGFETFEEFFDAKRKQEEEDAERMKELYSEVYNSIFQIASNNIAREAMERQAAINSEEEKELASLQKRYDAGLIGEEQYRAKQAEIQERYDEERKRIQREQAEKEKALAIFQATIQGAVAVIKAGVITPLALAAAIAAAAQIAAIASTPIPQFFEGTDYLMPWASGQGRRKDDIPVMAHMGEAIINSNRNKEAPGLAKAWNSGNLEKWIFKQYDVPAIRDKVAESEREEKNSFARNIADSLIFNSNNGDLIRAINRSSRKEREDFERLIGVIRSRNRQNRRL